MDAEAIFMPNQNQPESGLNQVINFAVIYLFLTETDQSGTTVMIGWIV